MRLYPLPDKTAVLLKNNAEEFIKQYSTNTAEANQNAFVDLKGRIVAVFDQKFSNRDEAVLVLERPFLPRLKRHLEKYLFLMETKLEEDPRKVYFDLEGRYEAEAGETVIAQKKGALVITPKEIVPGVSGEEFTLFRLQNHFPLQGVDFDEEMLLDVAREERVSYTKGCYLGQEIIARVHHRGKAPKKLAVLSEDKVRDPDRMTSKVKDPTSGKMIGFIFVENE